jgi:hypothetical protein
MAGIPASLAHGHYRVLLAALVIVVFVAGAMAASSLLTHNPPPPLDWFAVVTASLVVVIFLWPPQFHNHFSAFLAPFLALAVALSASGLLAAIQPRTQALGAGRWLRWIAVSLAGVVIAGLGASQVRLGHWHVHLIAHGPAAVQRVIPPGACALSDEVSYLLLANRFISDVPGCPRILDGLGTDLALSNGLSPATGAGRIPAVAAVWGETFQHAQYVLLTAKNSRRIAWTPAMRTYFQSNFRQVLTGHGYHLYKRKALRSP